MYPYAAWEPEGVRTPDRSATTRVESTDGFYYVTLTPYIGTPNGNRIPLGPIRYAVPVRFVEALPRDYPCNMKSYVDTFSGVSFPTMNAGFSGGYRLSFEVDVSTEDIPQAELIPITEVNDEQSNQDTAA